MWCVGELLEDIDGAGECGQVVAPLSVEETGMGQSPHVLRLYLRTCEPALHQHPHKDGQEVYERRSYDGSGQLESRDGTELLNF